MSVSAGDKAASATGAPEPVFTLAEVRRLLDEGHAVSVRSVIGHLHPEWDNARHDAEVACILREGAGG